MQTVRMKKMLWVSCGTSKITFCKNRKIELKEDHVCFSYEDAEDILVLETNVLGNPTYDEEVISDTGHEQTTCDQYPNKDDKEQSSPVVPVYYDCESDPWESHEDYDSDPWERHEEEEGKPNE
jgi:hypothetical protein